MPELKQTEPMTVAFVQMRGPYEQMPMGYARLYNWLEGRWLTPMGMPHAVYLTDPAEVPEADAVWELWSPIAGQHADEGPDETGVGIKRVEPKQVASALHKGPYENMEETYGPLMLWIAEQGLRVNGAFEEVYYSDPNAGTAPKDYLTEVLIPVERT